MFPRIEDIWFVLAIIPKSCVDLSVFSCIIPPMKILHIIAGASHGGAETFAIDAILALKERGVEQFVLCRPHDNFLDPLRQSGIPYETLTFLRWKKWLERRVIDQKIKSYAPDLVHCWMSRAAEFMPKGGGVPVLGWSGGKFKMKYFTVCDYYMAVTRGIFEELKGQAEHPDRAFLGHTFGTLKEDPPLSREEFGIPENKRVVLMLARMHSIKGVDTLLYAALKMDDVFLLLAGDGPELDAYRMLARDLGLKSRVRFTGWRRDRSALLELADILALPSRGEPFGTVMAEAWYKGVPVVAAKAEGPRQYIKHCVNGMLSEIDDVDGLANNLRAVLEDEALRSQLIAGGTHTYETMFSKEVVVSKLLSTYEEIVRRGVPA